MKFLSSLLAFLLLPLTLLAWQDNPEIRIAKANVPIVLDGLLEEDAWTRAAVATNFYRQFPNDSGLVAQQTVVRLTFDDKNIYIGAICYEPRADYTMQSYRRDYLPGTSDVFNILFDPSKDGLNGFIFGISPFNVQREALISNGTTQSYEWDNKWESRVTNYDDRWVLEVAIPFKTLRYTVSSGVNSWKMNFTRARLKDFEVSTWARVPLIFPTNNLAFTGLMTWDSPPPKPGRNVSVIPYGIANYDLNYQRNDTTLALVKRRGQLGGNLGGDVKIAISSGLNLDLTINPDFSQVEVDRQVANLSRFELFFPELRQSFLENRDLFAMFGFPSTRPFFSRRIGLAYNPASRQYEKVPILAGARLSGKLNDNWRIGVLDMQTARKDFGPNNIQPAANFGVLTAQRKVLKRSTISGIFVNKQNFMEELTPAERGDRQPWNRVAGLEFNLYSQDYRWEGEWYYHRSLSPDPKQRGGTFSQFLGYNARRLNVFSGFTRIDSNYTAEAGFVPRPGVQSVFAGGGWQFYPKSGWMNRNVTNFRLGFSGDQTYSLKGKETDRDLYLGLDFTFKSQANLSFGVYNNYTYLFEAFDPTYLGEAGERPLDGNKGYTYNGFRGEYYSSTSYDWQMQLNVNAGEFYNGNLYSANGRFSYRIQPYGSIALLYSYNSVQLPKPYVSADFWLIGPRFEFAFTRNLFTSTFFQYNTQANNLNINARLQWRFAPASDVFLVYTDNSFAQEISDTQARFLSPKNKALVLKVVYWMNL